MIDTLKRTPLRSRGVAACKKNLVTITTRERLTTAAGGSYGTIRLSFILFKEDVFKVLLKKNHLMQGEHKVHPYKNQTRVVSLEFGVSL